MKTNFIVVHEKSGDVKLRRKDNSCALGFFHIPLCVVTFHLIFILKITLKDECPASTDSTLAVHFVFDRISGKEKYNTVLISIEFSNSSRLGCIIYVQIFQTYLRSLFYFSQSTRKTSAETKGAGRCLNNIALVTHASALILCVNTFFYRSRVYFVLK